MPETVSSLGLVEQGLHSAESIAYNSSYDDLFEAELDSSLPQNERGVLTSVGAVSVDTGRFTGRSPKDKYIVCDAETESKIWWSEAGSDNQKMTHETWETLKGITLQQLNGKRLYVVDAYCGASEDSRLKVRLVTEIAWQAHFFKNMFIRPTESELDDFHPDWTIFNACKTQCDDFKSLGLNSPVFVAFNISEKMTLIAGTWYGGEMKKGIFSMMNYFLPLRQMGAFHCSANACIEHGDTALFFGLSGTGKTTLSTDPKRLLIGDDEHGWDDRGIFNFEGGCYAKAIDLKESSEPEIYAAIRRNALLENVVIDEQGVIDYSDASKTQNTRVSYPIEHIERIVKPVSKGEHPSQIIFLTCDAYGVLPPVSILTKEQAMFQFVSGYTAKVAGTELGVTEPTATFSACFGKPFLTLHPIQYAEILGRKMTDHSAKAYLVNTGWTGGIHGVGHRISIANTRAIIDAILSGDIEGAETETMPYFNMAIPKSLPGCDNAILNPVNTWADAKAYDDTARMLAAKFIANAEKFEGHAFFAQLRNAYPVIADLL